MQIGPCSYGEPIHHNYIRYIVIINLVWIDYRNVAIIEKIGDIPCILVINKADTVRFDELLPVIDFYSKLLVEKNFLKSYS